MRPSSDTIGTMLRHFNDFVRGELRRRNETQEGLAAYLDVNRSTISYRLNGKVEWTLKDAFKACEYFETTLEEVTK